MKRDIILILEEGIMLGVFGAGVVTAFQEANLYPRILGVCGSSSGAHNAAYFLSQQTRLGSSIYYDELSGSKFIKKNNIFYLVKDLITFKHSGNNGVTKVVDLDYLIRVERTIKRLDTEAIKNSPIEFYVRVFDIKERRHRYINAKEDTLKAIKASSSSPPFYSRYITINGRDYIDGSVIRTKSFLDIVKRNSDKKIIYVINRRKSFGMVIKTIPLELLEFFLMLFMIGPRVAIKKLISIEERVQKPFKDSKTK